MGKDINEHSIHILCLFFRHLLVRWTSFSTLVEDIVKEMSGKAFDTNVVTAADNTQWRVFLAHEKVLNGAFRDKGVDRAESAGIIGVNGIRAELLGIILNIAYQGKVRET